MINLKNIKISHRGLHNNIDIPENSMKAFKKSIDNNIPIELDVHMLKDNNIVVFHDNNIKRMTGINKELKDLTYDELKRYKLLNTNEHIPLLKDILSLVDGKVLLNIEVKYNDNYEKACKELSKMLDNYNGDFIVQSFSPKVIHWFKKNRPNYTRGLLLSSKQKGKYLYNAIIFKILKPHFLSISKKLSDQKIMKHLNKYNIPILFWTIKKDEVPKYTNKDFGIIYEEK